MPTIKAESLKKLCFALLKAAGTSTEESEIVAEIIIRANLRGVDSHGVRNIPRYIQSIKGGTIVPDAPTVVLRETLTTAMWDVNNAFGFVAGKKAMETAIRKAQQHKFGAVGTLNSKDGEDHIGALYYYAEMAALKDMIGVVTCSGKPLVAAWGGTSRMLGINPIAIAIPAGKFPPIILDISTTQTSRGHLYVKQLRGESIPEGWILDKEGKSSINPQDFFDGGALLPFGTYKGYGLSVIIEAITGAIGAGCSHDTSSNGHFYLAIDPTGFTTMEEFKDRVDGLIKHLKASHTVPGVDQVFVPGEIGNRTMEKRLKEGIPVDEAYWSGLVDIAKTLGVDPEEVME
jgi:LDH2 family malate/lactate/ureidoglycolate dehydrogenase